MTTLGNWKGQSSYAQQTLADFARALPSYAQKREVNLSAMFSVIRMEMKVSRPRTVYRIFTLSISLLDGKFARECSLPEPSGRKVYFSVTYKQAASAVLSETFQSERRCTKSSARLQQQ